MENVKKQIRSIIFGINGNTLPEFSESLQAAEKRLSEGLKKMANSALWTLSEVSEAQKYISEQLEQRVTAQRSALVEALRAKFEF